MPPAYLLLALSPALPVLALAAPQRSTAAVSPAMTVSLDLMGQPCTGMIGPNPLDAKPGQLVAIGYVRGYVDAAAAACDQVDRTAGFCGRLFAAKVKGEVFEPSTIAGAVTSYCALHSRATMGDAVRQFMRDAGVLDPAPKGEK